MLTDIKIRAAKPAGKPFKLYDMHGLFLLVNPNGSKLWRMKYMLDRKQHTIALGRYPEVSLADARRLRDEARAKLQKGGDPAQERRQEKEQEEARQQAEAARAASTFGAIFEQWYARKAPGFSESTRAAVTNRMARHVLPVIGGRPIGEITAAELLRLLEGIVEAGKHETAAKCKNYIAQVFDFAALLDLVQSNPARALRGVLPKPEVRHMPAPTDDVQRLAQILQAVWGYRGAHSVRAALRVLPFVFVRPGELRTMRWADIDFTAKEWRFISSKKKRPHTVPLARQVIEELEALRPFTGGSEWVFQGERRGRPISENTLGAAYRTLGIPAEELVAHGWRAVARTLLHERLGYPPEVIEAQLSHSLPGTGGLGESYLRALFIEHRRAMMQEWADYLDALRQSTSDNPTPRATLSGRTREKIAS